MKMSDEYLNDQLSKAQALLWSGSLHEVDEAHNIVSNLIRDKLEQVSNQGQIVRFTTAIYNPVNFCYNQQNDLSRKDKTNDNKA